MDSMSHSRCINRVKVLHARYLLQLLHEVRRVLRTLPTVMHASTLSAQRITVCGDLHGKLNDLLLIFWKVNSSIMLEVFSHRIVSRGVPACTAILWSISQSWSLSTTRNFHLAIIALFKARQQTDETTDGGSVQHLNWIWCENATEYCILASLNQKSDVNESRRLYDVGWHIGLVTGNGISLLRSNIWNCAQYLLSRQVVVTAKSQETRKSTSTTLVTFSSCDIELWPLIWSWQDEPARQISRSVISFISYSSNSQTDTHRTKCSTWTIKYTVSQKTSHLWLAITLTHMNWFWHFLAEMLTIK